MHLTYQVISFQEETEHIVDFLQTNVDRAWWLEGFYQFYPQTNWNALLETTGEEQRNALIELITPLYEEQKVCMLEKQKSYQLYWDEHEKVIEKAFSELFGRDISKQFAFMVGKIGLKPICPRYLATQSFDVFYLNSAQGAMGIALHEIVHFVWFAIWQAHFHDNPLTYEMPHLKWIFSEMVTDTFMRDARLYALNPYMQEGTAYEYFYHMKINGAYILDVMYELFQQRDIISFMQEGYAYCCAHEQEIRAQMK